MELHTVFQPIQNLLTGATIGYEALLRGSQPPEKLFEQAKENGSLAELDKMARGLALQEFNHFNNGYPLFINCHPLALEHLEMDFSKYPNLDPSQVVVEITEQSLCNLEMVKKLDDTFKLQGIHWAIDDYGHGYTNLTLLKTIQPAYIKLDRELLKTRTNQDYMLLVGIKKMAEWMNIEIIAEGIETIEQKKFLIDCGISLGQGYYIGKPDILKKVAI